MIEIILHAIEFDDLILFIECLNLIKDIYMMFGEIVSALHTLNSLRILYDITNN